MQPVAYQVYFADLTEENQALVLTLLRLKEEAGKLEPGEADLLMQIRGPAPAYVPPDEPAFRGPRPGRRPPARRGFGNGRGYGQGPQ